MLNRNTMETRMDGAFAPWDVPHRAASENPYRLAFNFLYKVSDAECAVRNLEKRISLYEAVEEAREDCPADGRTEEGLVVLSAELGAAEMEAVIARRDVADMIAQLSDPSEQAVLIGRYVERKDYSLIALENFMTEKKVKKVHANAVAHMQEVLERRTA